MTNIMLPTFHRPSAEMREKAGMTICGVCVYAWGIAGLFIIIGLVSKLAGLV